MLISTHITGYDSCALARWRTSGRLLSGGGNSHMMCVDAPRHAFVRAISRLVTGVRIHRDDDQILSTLAGLPVQQDTRSDLPQRVGVANEDGEIYRHILVHNSFELLQLTARLNAKGFSVSADLRHKRVGHYERIFVKGHPTGR
jgi:hypothetical protein